MKIHTVKVLGGRTKKFRNKAKAWRYALRLIKRGQRPMLWTYI